MQHAEKSKAAVPPTEILGKIADTDGENRIDTALRAPVESKQESSFVEKGDVSDDERKDLVESMHQLSSSHQKQLSADLPTLWRQ